MMNEDMLAQLRRAELVREADRARRARQARRADRATHAGAGDRGGRPGGGWSALGRGRVMGSRVIGVAGRTS